MGSKLNAVTLLTGLVERYSPSEAEYPAVKYLVSNMQGLGFHAFVDSAGNAVGELGSGEKTLVLLGHIDTVPGHIPIRHEGNLLFGRGTVDAKGPLASFVCAAARAGVMPGWQIVVVGAVEEESATSKGARHILERYHPEAVIIGEPSQWNRVTVGYKGRLLVDYKLTSFIRHTAGPEISVCEHAHAFWHAITQFTDSYNAKSERIFNQLSPSLRSMGSTSDGFVESAIMTIGFRLPENLDAPSFKKALTSLAEEADLNFRGYEPAFRAPKNTPLARAFIKAIQFEGERLQFKLKSGTSDMNVVGPVWQCPILAYGPGDSSLDHTPGEHIDLEEYQKAINVLTNVIRELCV